MDISPFLQSPIEARLAVIYGIGTSNLRSDSGGEGDGCAEGTAGGPWRPLSELKP